MPSKILRRCTICKKFHASYLVNDQELGKCYLCLSCWKARTVATRETQLVPSQARNVTEFSAGKAVSEDHL